MRSITAAAFIVSLVPATVAGQQNPFALTGGSVKSAYITYDVTSKGVPMSGSTMELGVAGQKFALRLNVVTVFEGEKLAMKIHVVENRDSVYRLTDDEGEVSLNFRPLLAKEFEALDPAGKQRVLANLKLAQRFDEDELALPLIGEKIGTQTIAGQRCDEYRAGKRVACVLPDAPAIPLRMTDTQGLTWVAKKVTLNAPLSATLVTLPKGIRWKKKGDVEHGELALGLWRMKNPFETEPPAPPAVARFAIRYLASPQAAGELKQEPSSEETDETSAEADTTDS
ncbi:MAG: hypothetical protein ACJ8BF_06655 [Gemmatimonadales bacterium]